MHKKIWKANHSVTSVKKIISLEWLVWKTRSITLAEQKKKECLNIDFIESNIPSSKCFPLILCCQHSDCFPACDQPIRLLPSLILSYIIWKDCGEKGGGYIWSYVWGHPLSTYAKFSEKLTFLTLWYAYVRVRISGL